jgi:arginyl-tRNA synthetase
MLALMRSLKQHLEERVRTALVKMMGPEGAEVDPLIRPTQDPRFGDYQSNVALGLARRLSKKPRDLGAELCALLPIEDMCAPPELSGPGFINFRMLDSFVASELAAIQVDPRLGVAQAPSARRVVVDFSSPNLAKEMHIGHLRSTIIGDSIARLLEFLGHDVVRLNHVGDWGTQFGMLIQHVRESSPEVLDDPSTLLIDDLEAFYVRAKQRFDQEPAFQQAARQAVVDLQAGEPSARVIWEAFCDESLRHCHEVYRTLDVELVDRGESFYNSMLPGVVEDLLSSGLAVEHEGAICFFLEGWLNRDKQPMPLMVRKSDGGYNYDTTDLAAARHRVEEERADRIIYVTDLRQKQHFDMLFAGVRKAGWAGDPISLEHVGFGMVLGSDRKPYRTRDGGTVKLREVLQEAERRAALVVEKNSERLQQLTPRQRQRIAEVVGVGAVKYADLSHNAASDYVFDWDTMLDLHGNTAVYMLYAYARIRSIGRRAGVEFDDLPPDVPIRVEHPSEVALGKLLLEFVSVIEQFATELRPHVLTDYLYQLSRAYSTFYDRERGVRVVDATPEETRLSRLRLCDLTARTLKIGLSLLGIEVVEQM